MKGRQGDSIGIRLWFAVLLFVAIVANLWLYAHFETRINELNRVHDRTRDLVEEIKQFSDDRARMAYSYVVTGDERYRDLHRELVDIRSGRLNRSRDYRSYFWSLEPTRRNQRSLSPRVPFVQRMREAGFNESEIPVITAMRSKGDRTVVLEEQAIGIVAALGLEAGHHAAIDILWGPEYRALKTEMMQTLRVFRNRVDQRTRGEIEDAERTVHWLQASLLLITLLMLGSLLSVRGALYRLAGGSLRTLTELIGRLPAIDADTAVLAVEPARRGTLYETLAKAHNLLAEKQRERDFYQNRIRTVLADLERAQQVAQIGSWTLDIAGGRLELSRQAYRICAIEPDTAMWLDDFVAMVHPEDRTRGLADWEKALAGAEYDCRFRIVTAEGPQWVRSRAEILRDADGTPLRALGTLQLITRQVATEAQVQLYASVFTSAREGIIITDLAARVIDANAAFTEITGYAREEVIGKRPNTFGPGRQGRDQFRAFWRGLREKGFWSGEVWNRRKNGEVYPELLTVSTVYDESGKPVRYIGLFTDISLQKEQQRQLEHSAYYDRLTGLPNRALLGDRLQQEMAKSLRDGHKVAIAFIDLDEFKDINDDYGHEAGDHVLVAVAERIKGSLRAHETVARLGGDEFVAVIGGLESEQDCLSAVGRILESVAEPIPYKGFALGVSASIGVTFHPQSIRYDGEQLLRQADQAMYHAKQSGKNRFQFFDEAYDRDLRMRNENLERIRQALANGEFVLYYQPKVNMRTGEVIGAEALVRWQHPAKGLLPPGHFLPDIEDTLLEPLFGDWVIATALADCRRLKREGFTLPFSVNVSARHLEQPDFTYRLREQMQACGDDDRCRLELEILETSALQDLELVSAIIEECRGMDVGFALDDFGTGYSSLTYLRRLPVDLLKIDQSFVRGILESREDIAVLKSILNLAGALGRNVIAEGVETAEHGRILLELGCLLGQGYSIARPMPASQLSAWLRSWRPDPLWR